MPALTKKHDLIGHLVYVPEMTKAGTVMRVLHDFENIYFDIRFRDDSTGELVEWRETFSLYRVTL